MPMDADAVDAVMNVTQRPTIPPKIGRKSSNSYLRLWKKWLKLMMCWWLWVTKTLRLVTKIQI